MIENHMAQGNAEHDATHEPDDFDRWCAEETISLPEYWLDLTLGAEQANQMARIMGELNAACNGDDIAIKACLNALHHIQKQAITDILEDE